METEGLVVTGVGEVRAEPDTAVVRLSVCLVRPSVLEATIDAMALAGKVGHALEAAGMAEGGVQSIPVSVEPVTGGGRSHGGEASGYRACHAVTARISPLDGLEPALDQALTIGGDELAVKGIDFESTALRGAVPGGGSTMDAARAAAFADCRARARQLAALAGLRLGTATEINEVSVLDGGPEGDGGPVKATVAITVRYHLVESHSGAGRGL